MSRGVNRLFRAAVLALLALTATTLSPIGSFGSPAHAAVCAPSFPGPNATAAGQDGRLTPDGRYLVYTAADTGLPNDTNNLTDIVRVDRTNNSSTIVSVGTAGASVGGASSAPSITPDGRFVAFKSDATNLVANDTNGSADIFVRDLTNGTTERVSVTDSEGQASAGFSLGLNPAILDRPAITPDGRFVAFVSGDAALVAENNGQVKYPQVFVRDRQTGATTRESLPSTPEVIITGGSYDPTISDDGRYLAFTTLNIAYGGVKNTMGHVILRDRQGPTDVRITGPEANRGGNFARITADGSEVIFTGQGSVIAPSTDSNLMVITYKRVGGTYELVNPDYVRPQSISGPMISPDGRYVGFNSPAPLNPSGSTTTFVMVVDRETDNIVAEPGGATSINGAATEAAAPRSNGSTNAVAVIPLNVARIGHLAWDQLKQGETYNEIGGYGSNMNGATLNLGPGITVQSMQQSSPWLWIAKVSVSTTAPLGTRSGSASRDGCSSTSTNQFTVAPAVLVTSVTPNKIAPTKTRELHLAGDGFKAGATVSAGAGVTMQVTSFSNQDLTVSATAAANVTSGTRNVEVHNTDGSVGICTNCLTIDATAPTVEYIGPSDKDLEVIAVALGGDDTDFGETEITVRQNGNPVAFEKGFAQPNVILLGLENPTNGNYEVRVRTHDFLGNVGPEVLKVVQRNEIITTLNAYGPFTGGAETTAGDVDGDGVDELITAAGPGGGPHVRVFRVNAAQGSSSEAAGWYAYGESFTGGVRVAAADLDGDGTDEVITGTGPGGAPHVRAFHVNANGSTTEVASFYAYDKAFDKGVFVAGGDIDGVGGDHPRDEIIVGPGAGGGPHVRAFGIDNGQANERIGFMAYDPRFSGGVRVGAADLDGDGIKEFITAAGPGGGPHVQAFAIEGGQKQLVSSFYAYDERFTGGVFLASADVDGDGLDELLVGAGRGGGPHIKVLAIEGPTVNDITTLASFYAYDANFAGGVSAAGGDADGDGDDDVVTTPGPGMPVQTIVRRIV